MSSQRDEEDTSTVTIRSICGFRQTPAASDWQNRILRIQKAIQFAFRTSLFLQGHSDGSRQTDAKIESVWPRRNASRKESAEWATAFRPKDALKQKVYDTVLLAQEVAIKAIKVGVRAKQIDQAARDVIDKAGFENTLSTPQGMGLGWIFMNCSLLGHDQRRLLKKIWFLPSNQVFTCLIKLVLVLKIPLLSEKMVQRLLGED